MNRQGARKRSLESKRRRRTATREPRPRILVVCEGKETEPRYLEEYCQEFRDAVAVRVEIEPGAGIPKTVVERAASMKRSAEREARRARDRFLGYDDVWCVFDVDDHPKLVEARQQAEANDISIAQSNPCVELWGLLHFQEHPTGVSRQDLLKKLLGYLPKYEKILPFRELLPHLGTAIERADRQATRMIERGEPDGNPSTGFHRLLGRLRS